MEMIAEIMKWDKRWVEIFLLLQIFSLSSAGLIYDTQPRLLSKNGHLFIYGAEDSNITLKTKGKGFVNINDQEILQIAKMAQHSAKFVEAFQTTMLPMIQGSYGSNDFLLLRIRKLESAVFSGANSTSADSSRVTRRLRFLTVKVNNLIRKFNTLRAKLMEKECTSDPCQNGGTCLDLFNGFHCHCPPNWQGPFCEIDVDECQDFAGTELGCKNGGTCRNYKGSYACSCPIGFYGLHCTERTYDCSVRSSSELCGHGVCVNQGGNARGFVCICDEGWTTSEGDGTCTKDKNECEGPYRPCSHDPFVECRNTIGSFSCGHCPPGYTGNGFHCLDIDECQINNGGCSISPMVSCNNTRGSRICGPCPPGYAGDGFTCTRAGRCQLNNGFCHPLATCEDNSALSYVVCHCPPGYIGSGIGPNGCAKSANGTDPCASSPCHHGGSCVNVGNAGRYMCLCRHPYTGPNCSETADPCSSGPCQNGGTCVKYTLIFRIDYFRCICPQGFSGRTCGMRHEACVESVFGHSGSVTWPTKNHTQISSRLFQCAWTLKTFPSKVINLTFTDMKLMGIKTDTRCLFSYVEVFDGLTSTAPLIGQYCEVTNNSKSIISTHPYLYLTAKLQMQSSLSFNWTAVLPQCGGQINAISHGTISSPGSPGPYPKNAHCLWTLIGPPGKRIQLTFFSLDIETHRNCSFDYLEIRNGDSETSPLLKKICNSTLPSPIITSGSTAMIVFHTDNTRSGRGFQIAYSTRESIPGCGGTFTTPHGQFSPPYLGGGKEYMQALTCEWLIELPIGERIGIALESFSLEASTGCQFDSLSIYDGPTRDSGLMGRWCGRDMISPLTSTSNAVLVVFESDYNVNEGGFLLKYSSVCGGTFMDDQGVIQSPYYPNFYPEDRICTYTIQLPLGSAIKLQFTDFDIEDQDCAFDKLKIFDGNSKDSKLIGEYCGTHSPGEVISTHNIMYLVFETDSSNHGKGFRANYSSIDISCGGILTGKFGTINSPNFPEKYPANHDCTWVISGPPGTIIQLTWLSFNIDFSYRCNRDYMKIFDNNTVLSLSGQLGEKYCGTKPPPPVTSSSNIMSIVFHTDGDASAPGFSVSYTAIEAQHACGGHFFTTTGEIRSPNYPNGYPNNLDCRWIISVPNGRQIELKPVEFNLEDGSFNRCNNDYLEIRNGGLDNSPLIGRYCGSNLKSNIISMTNQLFLRFVSDEDGSRPGFKILWDGASTGCGGTLSSSSGAIMSPNYPQPYGNSGVCTWKIIVAEGSTIALTIIDLELEDHNTCALDYLEVYDGGNNQGRKLAKMCRSDSHPSSLSSTGNKMFLRFRADVSRSFRGFSLKYDTVCNLTLKGYGGAIESPGFPDGSRVSQECLWKIVAPEGNKINISVSHFSIKDFLRCGNSFMKIYDGSKTPTNLIGTYCNNVVPTTITSNLNEVFIHYNIGSGFSYLLSSMKQIFRLEWVVSGCGGVYKLQQHGVITSPNYPKVYPHSVTCEWYISVPPGNSVKLTVDDIQIEKSDNCAFDAIEVYGGPDDSSPQLAKLCHRLNSKSPSILTTSGNSMFVRFRTDTSTSGIGFHATYDVNPSKCGGEFTSVSGAIHSHNYPQNYEPHDDCNFIIKVDDTHRINLTFSDFDIDAYDKNCTNAFVKVYDGDSADAPLLKTLCGNRLPESILSTSNTLFVRHKADSLSVAKGFYATYQPACGAILSTDSRGFINFAESNSSLPWTTPECTWIIRSKFPSSKFRMQFALLEIPLPFAIESAVETNGSSVRTGVNIFAGEGTDAPLFGHYSQSRLPPPFIVQSSSVTVVFKRDDETGYAAGRFILDYSVLDTACGGTLTAEGGTIVSPGYPDPYPNNVECVWNLMVAPGNRMNIDFTKFNLQDSDSCDDDYLEIRRKSESGSLIGVFCGSQIPNRTVANSTLWIKFRSGTEGSAPGFVADFALETHSDLEGFLGAVGSPFYPLSYYFGQTYTWRITVNARNVIRFAFTDFLIESYDPEDCNNDLRFYDGYDNSAPLIKVFCGYEKPAPFTSGSNVVYVEMRNIYNTLGTRFLLDWMQMEKDPISKDVESKGDNCTTYVELKREVNGSHAFQSPGFPYGYANNLNCEWVFQAPLGSHVQLRFFTINIESFGSCHADSVKLYNEDKTSSDNFKLMETLCSMNGTSKVFVGTRVVKMVFSTDSYTNRTGFSGKASAECGGEINEPNGVIAESGYSRCQWNITVKPGRTIKVKFEKFLVRGSAPCTTNFLVFRDGGRPDSPFLGTGKYCGDSIIEVPETTSNRLYVLYRSLYTEGFIMKFEEKSIACGGIITLTKYWKSENFSSPNYPNVPPAHIECAWKIFAPSGESIHFEVTKRFDMTWTKECTAEYLELREGSTENGYLIGRYCKQPPDFITTDGNALYVKYFTDTNEPKDGFSAVVSISKCGGTIYTTKGEKGMITSPGYPQSYEENLNCTWRLVGQEWSKFSLNITTNMGYARGNNPYNSWRAIPCRPNSDNLTIREVLSEEVALIGPESMTFCGTSAVINLESETNEILIKFISLKQIFSSTKRFFTVNYSVLENGCGSDINLPSGEIKSPNYPRSFQGKTYCTWRITVPEGRRVSFRVIDLDLEPTTNNETRPQVLIFFHSFMYNRIISLTGDRIPSGVIESSGNKMMILYKSTYKTTHRGFIGNYTSYEPALCGGKVTTGSNGSLTLPQSMLSWNSSYTCEWSFVNTNKSLETITFFLDGVILPNNSHAIHQDCFFSASKITFSDTRGIRAFCGETQPNKPLVISNTNSVTQVKLMKMIWAKEYKYLRFSLSWRVFPCGGVITVGGPIVIKSPGEDSYPPNFDCVWSFSGTEGSALKIKFLSFDLGLNCEEDYLKIYNGKGPNSPLMSQRCGSIVPANLISQSSNIWMHFHSSSSVNGKKGFSLEISPADTSCGGILHLKNGVIRSPGYPSNYKNNIECDWEIQASVGYHIGLKFTGRFFIQSSPNCTKDYIEVSDYVGDEWKILKKLCGRDAPSTSLNTTSNRMRIFFKTDNDITADGFQAAFNWNCGGVIEVQEGFNHLYSPGWPGLYTKDLKCNYTLVSSSEKIINLQAEAFDLEGGSVAGCFFDFVQFYVQTQESDKIQSNGHYCGKALPPQQKSFKRMEIIFTSDGWLNYKGFHFVYSTSNCGGNINSETAIYGSDIDFIRYDYNKCTWNVTAPPDQIVIVKISELAMPRERKCTTEYLSLFDTSDSSANDTLIAKICGYIKNKPAFFYSTGNKMRIELFKYNTLERDEFQITIGFKYGPKAQCGGDISLPTMGHTTIQSPDIDRNGKYENNMDCSWVVKGQLGSTVLVNFEKMDLKTCNTTGNSSSICCDAVEIYDGPSINSNLVGTYCGQSLPRSVSSSSNFLTVRFITDEFEYASGFKITLLPHSSPCGQPILNVTHTPQYLTSPNFPNNYPVNIHCDWLLHSDDFSSIALHFELMDIENSTNCINDRIEIVDAMVNLWRHSADSNPNSAASNVFVGTYNPYWGSWLVPFQKFCGSQFLPDYYSSSKGVRVKFISDSQYSFKGFKIEYRLAGCSRNYTSPEGRIRLSKVKAPCTIRIDTPINTTISLYFLQVHLLSSGPVCNSKLEVFEKGKNISTACGFGIQPPVFSKSNSLELKLSMISKTAMSTIDLTYASTDKGPGCGGKFYNHYGAFTSPGYPGNFRNFSYCCWEVNVPLPNFPKITFTEFDIGIKATCDTDYVEMFDVNSATGNRILRTTYCGGDIPAEFIGIGQSVAVCYKTSVHNSGIGWRAVFSVDFNKVAGPPVLGSSPSIIT